MKIFCIIKNIAPNNRAFINKAAALIVLFPVVFIIYCSSETEDMGTRLEPEKMQADSGRTADTTTKASKDPASLLKLKRKIIAKGKNPVLFAARKNALFNPEKWLRSDRDLVCKPYSRKISDYDKTIKKMARRYGFDWRLIAAQIYVESNFKNEAQSGVGAIGLMQVMPRTAKFMGYDPNRLVNPEINISVGCMYNQRMYSLWGKQAKDYNRLAFSLASYNAGRRRVLKSYSTKDSCTTWERVHPLLPEETQLYVHKIYLKHDFYKKHLLP